MSKKQKSLQFDLACHSYFGVELSTSDDKLQLDEWERDPVVSRKLFNIGGYLK